MPAENSRHRTARGADDLDSAEWPGGALSGSVLKPLWLDNPARPNARPALTQDISVDLLIVGGGFTGLWTALRAAERDPAARVLLIEAERIAEHASGRNGGFCEASITHGQSNGMARWPEEFEKLEELGRRNLDAIEATIRRYGIDCGYVRGGALTVATRSHEVNELDPTRPGFLDTAAVRQLVASPTYLAGRLDPDCALIDPARLAWGLASAAEQLGVHIAEHTCLVSLNRSNGRISAGTDGASVDAAQVVLATNVFPNPLRRLRSRIVPVFDYVLATEPLTEDQLESLHWEPTIGIADLGNRFHYYRLTPDRRILWGGYDAIYHFARSMKVDHFDRVETFSTLAQHFGATFPQLEGIRFTHRWSGVIDTSTRFCAFFGTALGRKVAYATGFTGLGVAASRFAADVMLDQLSGATTERTRLKMVGTKPLPFPPEPFAWLGIQMTRWALARADVAGKRNLWLRLLDRLGLGFGS